MNIAAFSKKFLSAGCALGCVLAWAQSPLASPKLPVMELHAGLHRITVEVAETEAAMRQGLMFRKSLGKNEGMLFRYPAPRRLCMWMKNTLIPLSVAFIDAQGRIVNLAQMKPQTLQAHCAAEPVPYALEMRQGWFREKGIGPGSVIEGVVGQK